jgi:hypothetical protein
VRDGKTLSTIRNKQPDRPVSPDDEKPRDTDRFSDSLHRSDSAPCQVATTHDARIKLNRPVLRQDGATSGVETSARLHGGHNHRDDVYGRGTLLQGLTADGNSIAQSALVVRDFFVRNGPRAPVDE